MHHPEEAAMTLIKTLDVYPAEFVEITFQQQMQKS